MPVLATGPAAPVDVRVEPRQTEPGYREDAVSFRSPTSSGDGTNDRVRLAYFAPHRFFPRRSAVVVLHSLGAPRARMERALCRALAARGLAVALLTLPYHMERRPHGINPVSYLLAPVPERMTGFLEQASGDVAATLTWLQGRPEVDPTRLGIVGISLGAVVGSLAMARDPRLQAAVLVLGGGDVAHILARGALTLFRRHSYRRNGLDMATLRRALAPVEPLAYARPLAPPRRMLMINGRYDVIIPPSDTRKLWRAFGEPPILWLETGHYGPSFLQDQLQELIGDFLSAAFEGRSWTPPSRIDAFTLRVGLLTGSAPVLTPAILLDLARLSRAPDLRIEAGLRFSGPMIGVSLGVRPGLDAVVTTYLFRGRAKPRAWLYWHVIL